MDLTRYANELEEGEATLMRNISARRHHETKVLVNQQYSSTLVMLCAECTGGLSTSR